MGWSAASLFCGNTFLGNVYRSVGGHLSADECAKRQVNALDTSRDGGLPNLTDEQKTTILKTIADLTQSAVVAAANSGATLQTVTLRDSVGTLATISIEINNWPAFAEEMSSNGASVTMVGGFAISFGCALLDPGVATGLKAVWDADKQQQNVTSKGMWMETGTRKRLEDVFNGIQ